MPPPKNIITAFIIFIRSLSCRSSGPWSADPQVSGKTGYSDGNATEKASSDPRKEKHTPLRQAKSSLKFLG